MGAVDLQPFFGPLGLAEPLPNEPRPYQTHLGNAFKALAAKRASACCGSPARGNAKAKEATYDQQGAVCCDYPHAAPRGASTATLPQTKQLRCP